MNLSFLFVCFLLFFFYQTTSSLCKMVLSENFKISDDTLTKYVEEVARKNVKEDNSLLPAIPKLLPEYADDFE